MHLVLGLGNPGRRYERTRHNVGFLVVDRLCARFGGACDKNQLGAEVGKLRIRDHDVIVAKPQQFMNLSGQAAVSLRGYYKVADSDVIVVHDELDLPYGRLQVKLGGGSAGHNGLKDISARFGAPSYVRVRFGVGRPPPGWEVSNYVLGEWTKDEVADLDKLIDGAADMVEAVVVDGLQAAMNRLNVRK